MSDSLALKVAKVERQLLRDRGISIPINLQEEDGAAEATRIVISATRGQPEMQDSATGIFNVSLMVDLKVQAGEGSSALVDGYLREIDAANNTVPTNAAALVAGQGLSVFIWKDDDASTEQDDGDDTRKMRRTLPVLAKEA
jgi:hypothetical protein